MSTQENNDIKSAQLVRKANEEMQTALHRERLLTLSKLMYQEYRAHIDAGFRKDQALLLVKKS